jgi:hypothetical protein
MCVLVCVRKSGLGSALVTFVVTQNLASIVSRQFKRIKARFAQGP